MYLLLSSQDVYHFLTHCTLKFVYKAYDKLIIKKNHNKYSFLLVSFPDVYHL